VPTAHVAACGIFYLVKKLTYELWLVFPLWHFPGRGHIGNILNLLGLLRVQVFGMFIAWNFASFHGLAILILHVP
jgi:hypothetical protein